MSRGKKLPTEYKGTTVASGKTYGKWQKPEAYTGSDGKTYYREPKENFVKVKYPRA